ncbi:AP2 domain-containing protein [Rummeliibacillus sp. POC4]|uniref:AP2 domain-containing protein n=1 Tax=Rummeliibacillus sp. POC4 TaxID=2305899 RepID=UPI000E66FD18|nr:AP2 domain-containing protein [Rummeliibacillus sp. POC4]RIJ63619.1 hypothetical protein D1606_14155 [Rummeliibacillus sp. POC4]
MVKEIPLQNGMFALVDDDDYERVNKLKWSVVGRGTTIRVKTEDIDLAYFILDLPQKMSVNIIKKNKNDLDFTKNNLIVGNRNKVAHFSRGQRNSTSKYKGVYWRKDTNKWQAKIGIDGKTKYLGCYAREEEAAIVYNNAALKYFGKDCYLNKIGEDNSALTIEIDKRPQHRRPKFDKQSSYKGVTKQIKGNYERWNAYIHHNEKRLHLGYFTNELDAAKAYDKKAIELFGDKAILNFPKVTQ